jgi:hypothetical protein
MNRNSSIKDNGKEGDRIQEFMERRSSLCKSIATIKEELEALHVSITFEKEEHNTLLETTKCYLQGFHLHRNDV